MAAQSVRSLALAEVTGTLNDQWSLFHNPAGLVRQDEAFICLSYLSHPFISELDLKYAGAAFHKNDKSIGISVGGQGDERLRIQHYSLVYSQSFGENFSLGTSVNLLEYSFTDIYGRKLTPFINFGALFYLSEADAFSFFIKNLNRSYSDKKNLEKVESIVAVTYRHSFSKLFYLSGELDKRTGNDVNFKVSWSYNFHKQFELMAGYQLLYKRFSIGFNFKLQRISFDLAFSYDTVFGIRPGLGASLIRNKD